MKAKLTKVLVIGSVIVAMLALFTGAVSAQDDGDNSNIPAQRDRMGVRDNIARGVIAEIMEQLGLTREEITAQLQEGATLAQIIEANDGSVEDIISALMADLEDRASETAEERLARIEERLTAILNGEYTLPRGERPNRPAVRGMTSQLMDIIGTETGLDTQDIIAQVRDGATLSEVIEANGGSVDAVTEATLAAVSEHLAEQVAEGTLTQEQADQRLERAESLLSNLLNGLGSQRNAA